MEPKSNSSCMLGVIISVVALIVAALAYFSPKKPAEATLGSTFDEKVRGIVLDVVKQNPQLLMDAMGEGISKKREETVKQLAGEIYKQKDDIAKQSLKFGKADSKSTVICFFDPLCKHCIAFQRSMINLIKAKKDVSFKMLPVAVLGEDSVTIAKVYIAVYEKSPEKAVDFIEKLTEEGSNMDKAAIEKAVKAAGLSSKDIEAILTDSDKKLAANGALAEKLKIPVVPAIFFIKGSNVTMVQTTGVDDLLKFIDSKEDVSAKSLDTITSAKETPKEALKDAKKEQTTENKKS